jgi:DNA-binding response OmpR family regulator
VGADDYVTKPCKPGELMARLGALVRRRSPSNIAKLRYDDLEVDRLEVVVRRAGREIALTPVEVKILVTLMLKNGCVASREYLHERVWAARGVLRVPCSRSM